MILGTHNSISYLKPKKWWMKLINFASKCQSLTIQDQWEYGVRYFDLRVCGSIEGECLAHGLIKYKGDIDDILTYLDNMARNTGNKCYVAINLEEHLHDIFICEPYILYFEEKIKYFKSKYQSLTICGGYCKGPWRKVVHSIENPHMIEKYWEFNDYKWSDNKFKRFIINLLHFCPEYWAKKDNLKYKKEYKNYNKESVLLLDFVQYGL